MVRLRRKSLLIILMVVALVPFILLLVDVLKHRDFTKEKIDRRILHKKHTLPKDKKGGNSIPQQLLSKTSTRSVRKQCDNEQKCNPTKAGVVNIHIVPHAHLDVGWKKTMDQYYLGVAGGNERSFNDGIECAECIFNDVISDLAENSTRRFIVAEMAFMSRWFYEQTIDKQRVFKKLVQEGRLELVGGGWCVSDSANTYYDDIIDQHTLGFQWIDKEFGECAQSNVGWHIDQFGHSREHSNIFAQMGYDALFLGRIDFQDQERRTLTGNMETVWRTSPNDIGNKLSLFTSVLYEGYFTPNGLRFGSDYPYTKASAYKTKHILVPFGGDFAFHTIGYSFQGIDAIIGAVNELQKDGVNVNALYSTPGCYINSVNSGDGVFETMETDFFPYSTIPNTFWVGFYTSRPGIKRHVKTASALLQTCRAISVLSRLTQVSEDIATLKKAVGILQHHDAITGTEMQHVTDDYNLMLSTGEGACQEVINTGYSTLLKTSPHRPTPPLQHFCDNLNISMCDVTETSERVFLLLFNPLGQDVSHWIRLPVPKGDHVVFGPHNTSVDVQLLPIPTSTFRIPERNGTNATTELVFNTDIPALGFALYNITIGKDNGTTNIKEETGTEAYYISNKFLNLTFDPTTGLTKALTNRVKDVEIDLQQNILYYISSEGQTRDPDDKTGGFLGSHKRPSGAYVFSPKEDKPPVPISPKSGPIKIHTYKTAQVQEVHQEFSPWASQVIRLYAGAPYLEFEWTIGPIPQGKNESKDVISRFITNLKTDGRLYTDINGRENMERRRNHRETWNINITNPVTGNYYPVTARMFLRDGEKNIQLTLLTDRSQGGASLKDGHMEIMIHRRTFKDDDMGVNEPLDERGEDGEGLICRGTHYVLLDKVESSAMNYRTLGLKIHHPPTMSFMVPEKNARNKFVNKFSGLRHPLPHNVHLLTLDQLPGDPDTLLLRLENYLEKGETRAGDGEIADVKLQNMFVKFDITSVRERSLGGNHNITQVQRLQWRTDDGGITSRGIASPDAHDVHSPPFSITLRPMQIRTFYVTTGPLGDFEESKDKRMKSKKKREKLCKKSFLSDCEQN